MIFLKSLLFLLWRVKRLEYKKKSPILRLFLMSFYKIYIMENISLIKMEADISAIHAMLQEVKEQTIGKVYNTQELSEYLKVGKSVIDKLLEKNHFSFVA